MTLTPKVTITHPQWNVELVTDAKPGKPFAVQDLRIRWGRDAPLDLHRPSTAEITVAVLDHADEVTANLINLGTQLTIEITVPGVGWLFRGFISSINARAERRGSRDAFFFDLEAVDHTATLKQVMWAGFGNSATGWSNAAETVLSRIKDTAAWSFFTRIETPAGAEKRFVQIEHTDYANWTIAQVLEKLFQSHNGMSFDYDPHTMALKPTARSVRSASPVILKHDATGLHTDTDPFLSPSRLVPIDASKVEVDHLGFSIQPWSRIGSVVVAARPYNLDKIVQYVVPVSPGGKQIKVDTILQIPDSPFGGIDMANVKAFAKEVASTADELTRWPLPPLLTREFSSAEDLDSPHELAYWLTTVPPATHGLLANSKVLAWINDAQAQSGPIPATVRPIGGEIIFDGRRWRVTHRAIHTPAFLAPDEGAATFDTLNDGGHTLADWSPATAWTAFTYLPQNHRLEVR